MHELSRMSVNYRKLASNGVRIERLTCVDFQLGMWEVKCYKEGHIARINAKAYVRAYLQDEFDGTDAEFFTPKADPEGPLFTCKFITWSM